MQIVTFIFLSNCISSIYSNYRKPKLATGSKTSSEGQMGKKINWKMQTAYEEKRASMLCFKAKSIFSTTAGGKEGSVGL